MKRETRRCVVDGVFLTLLAVALVAVGYALGLWFESQRQAMILIEELRKSGVPAGAVPR